jgi:hypothetical protein
MTAKIQTFLKAIPSVRVLAIGLILILAASVMTGFVWIQTDRTIAPPNLRALDWLWRVLVCHCSV